MYIAVFNLVYPPPRAKVSPVRRVVVQMLPRRKLAPRWEVQLGHVVRLFIVAAVVKVVFHLFRFPLDPLYQLQ